MKLEEERFQRVSRFRLRQEGFQNYGIANAHGSDYEIGYLIAPGPELGGVENIHNLWPEPYTSRTWNAQVEDALDETPPETAAVVRAI